MKNSLITFFSIILLSGSIFFSAASPILITHAASDTGVNASLYFAAPASPPVVGESFSVTVALSIDQPANAYAFSLQYNGSALRLDDVNVAGSIITVSPSLPTVQGNTISYVGGSFVPFLGSTGKLLTLDFTAIATGTDQIIFAPSSFVYLANGKGTKVAPQLLAASVHVLAGGAVQNENPVITPTSTGTSSVAGVDTTPPSITSLAFVADPFDQSHKLLGFLVSDAGSGMADMEVRTRSGLFWSGWEIAENPIPLANNVWEADLRIADHAGNTAEATIYDWPAFWKTAAVWGGMTIVGVIVIIFLIIRHRRNVKMKRPA